MIFASLCCFYPGDSDFESLTFLYLMSDYDKTAAINITDYRVGENEGVYLLNDACHFSPVLSPSVRICY